METRGGALLDVTLAGRGEVQVLAEREVWTAGVGSSGLVVACEAGAVWVTMEGDGEDHILRPGQRMHFAGPGLLAVQALQPSRVRVTQRSGALERPALRVAAG